MISPPETYTYQPLPSTNSIRVLDWAYDQDGPPSYRLLAVDLDSQPVFTALSYTWNLTKPLVDSEQALLALHIEIDGHIMPIGANLELALNRIHAASHSAPLWIDAICINQADPEERARQVNMMGRIFSSAALVIAWLGKDPIPPRTLSFLDELPHVDLHLSFDEIDLTECENLIKNMRETRYTDWLGVADLLGSAWFSRVWIIQEAVLAKQLLVYKGNFEISWEKLYDAAILVMTVFRHNLNSHSLRDASRTWVGSIAMMFHIRQARKDGIRWSFLKCLDFARAHGATDPRDKIFALLPLTAWPEGMYPSLLQPNYKLDSTHIYTACAQHLMETTGGLDLLSFVPDPASCRIQGLPSWVPDFSSELMPRRLGGDARTSYGVSLHQPSNINVDNGILRLQSALIDKIEHIGPVFEDLREQLLPHPKPQAILDLVAVLPTDIDQYASGEDLIDVLWRALCANTGSSRYPAPDSIRPSFLCWMSNLLFDAIKAGLTDSVYRFMATFEHSLPGIHENVRLLVGVSNEQRERLKEASKTFLVQLSTTYEDRRIFRTERNFIGISSKSLCVGDQIHLLAGGRVPVCLRDIQQSPASSTIPAYRFIGETYLHGFMESSSPLLPCDSFTTIELH